ncbi:MAG: glycoside hydrolase family 18 [Prevotella sp.]|jgi:hypothetical protein|nr:glycoside hydrolase family 18 [Prevotella sp.]MCI1281840.1 glycoside hydrolase family 18 [Prevotella sp.]
MKIKIFFSGIILASVILGTFSSCDTDSEALNVQDLTTYDEQYYANLRAFKKSDHEISYVYYAGWAPIEGATGYKDPASWGERIVGLPDSIDIVNLWMGVPTADTHPIAYKDMIETREKKGTRFVMHADASNYRHKFKVALRDSLYNQIEKVDSNGQVVKDSLGNVVYDSVYYDLSKDRSEAAIRAYARYNCDVIIQDELDGVDFDYEGWNSNDMYIVANECDKLFGPKGLFPEKLFIIDYFGGSPGTNCDPYVDYYIKQAYSAQGSGVGAGGHPDEKTVYCESFGQQPTGGQIAAYAAWEPGGSKHKGGCGAYYVGRNYYNTSDGIPYGAIRRAIQIMNPALNK